MHRNISFFKIFNNEPVIVNGPVELRLGGSSNVLKKSDSSESEISIISVPGGIGSFRRLLGCALGICQSLSASTGGISGSLSECEFKKEIPLFKIQLIF